MPTKAKTFRPAAAVPYDHGRKNAAARGYDHRWRKARVAYLRQHPLCRRCHTKGLASAASVVDHVIPHRGDETLFWDRDNWQPLCTRCHNLKTAAGE